MWLVITCYSSQLTFQSSIKSECSNRSLFSQLVNVQFLKCNQHESSLVQLHQIFTGSQTTSNSTLSSTTLKVKGNRLPNSLWNWDQKFNYINRLDYEFPIWQHLSQRLQVKTQVTTFALLDSFHQQASYNSG